MGVYILLFILGITLLIIGIFRIRKEKREGLGSQSYICRTKYIGGLGDISGGKLAKIDCKDTYLEISMLGKKEHVSYFNISNISVMSEAYITQSASLSTILAFGVVGLAMKKDNEKVRNYLVIELTDGRKIMFNNDGYIDGVVKHVRNKMQ